MSLAPSLRLHLFFAQDNDRAVILRQGPSKVFRMILWHRDTDRFEDGQWLKHKVYVERCDLSPDGQHFLFFALDGNWGSDARGSYTAISRPPYFTALALFPQGDTWGGGGAFFDNRHFCINGCADGDILGRAKGLARAERGNPSKDCATGIRLMDGTRAPLAPSAKKARLEPSDSPDPDPGRAYHTKGGRLYRRDGQELILIRDFTDMAFEPIRAPYDVAPDDSPSAWHPLQRDHQ